MSSPDSLPRRSAIAFVGLLVAPYLLNDLGNIYVHTPIGWLACDYGSRVFSLASIAWLIRRRAIACEDLLLRRAAAWRLGVAALVASAGGLALSSAAARTFFGELTRFAPGLIPFIEPPWLNRVDYWGGVALVAMSEELVFRGAIPRLIERAGGSWAVAAVVSSVLFGCAHWSLGEGSIVQTMLIGVIFALVARWGRGLWPVIVAHYVVDLVAFATG